MCDIEGVNISLINIFLIKFNYLELLLLCFDLFVQPSDQVTVILGVVHIYYNRPSSLLNPLGEIATRCIMSVSPLAKDFKDPRSMLNADELTEKLM